MQKLTAGPLRQRLLLVGPQLVAPAWQPPCMQRKKRHTPHAVKPKGFGSTSPQQQSDAKEQLHVCLEDLLGVPGVIPPGDASEAADGMYRTGQQLLPFIGPVELTQVEGSGRGVVTTRDVVPGELLLVCNPLALATAPLGREVSPAALVPHLVNSEAAGGEAQLAALALTAGSHSAPDFGRGPELSALHSLLHSLAALAWPSAATASTAAAAPTAGGGTTGDVQASVRTGKIPGNGSPGNATSPALGAASPSAAASRRAAARAALNAFGEPWPDVVAATLRGDPLRAHMGCWPAFAMLNHACAPTASSMVIGDQMAVRAAACIPAGQEVTITYAGTLAGAPLRVRRAAIKGSFGFNCQCDRCLVEQDYEDTELGSEMEASYEVLSQRLKPALLEALDDGDMEEAAKLVELVAKIYDDLMAALQQQVEDEEDRSVLQASVLPLALDLLSLGLSQLRSPSLSSTQAVPARVTFTSSKSQRQLNGPAGKQKAGGLAPGHPLAAAQGVVALGLPGVLKQKLQALSYIAPGSYAEAEVAARLLTMSSRKGGKGKAKSVDASALAECVRVHTVRYGTVSPAVLLSMLQAHGQNRLGDALADELIAAGGGANKGK